MATDLTDTPEERDARERARAEKDRALGSVPAFFIDTWHTLTFAGHVRITFGEMLGDSDNYRAAVVLDLDDAESLAHQLLRVVARRRTRDTERAARVHEDSAGED